MTAPHQSQPESDALLDEVESLQLTVIGMREELDKARKHIDGLEKLRPVWAFSDVKAQVAASALAQIWERLGVTNQTDAMQRLSALTRPNQPSANRGGAA